MKNIKIDKQSSSSVGQPWLLQSIRGRYPVVWVQLQELLYQIFGTLADLANVLNCSLGYFLEQLFFSGCPKWVDSLEHRVEKHSERPSVGVYPDMLSLVYDLRSHISGCPTKCHDSIMDGSYVDRSVHFRLKPKSMILTFISLFSRIFSGLMSLCTMFFECR